MMRAVLSFLLLSAVAGAAFGATGKLPAFKADRWVNSPALTPEALRGKVVLVDIWEFTCVNWIRTSPYVKAWDRDYGQLIVVQVADDSRAVGPLEQSDLVRQIDLLIHASSITDDRSARGPVREWGWRSARRCR